MRRSKVFDKLPKEVRVQGHKYDIEYKFFEDGTAGQVNWTDVKVQICDQHNHDRADKESTLIHEFLHLISHYGKFRLSENTVLALEKGIYNFLRENGWTIVTRRKTKKKRRRSLR